MCAVFSALNSEYPAGNLVRYRDVHFKQWGVTEFLVAEKQPVMRIHKWLKNIYGVNAVHKRTVLSLGFIKCRFWKRPSRLQWCTSPWLTNSSSHSPVPSTCWWTHSKWQIHHNPKACIWTLSIQGICEQHYGCFKIFKSVWSLGPRKPNRQSQNCVNGVGSQLLSHYEGDGESFQSRSSLGMKHGSNSLNCRQKRQSVAWHHPTSSQKMRCKATPSAGRAMATVLWGDFGRHYVMWSNHQHRSVHPNS